MTKTKQTCAKCGTQHSIPDSMYMLKMPRKLTEDQEQLIDLALVILDEHKKETKKTYLSGKIKDNKYRLVIKEKTLRHYTPEKIQKIVEIFKAFTANAIGLEGYKVIHISEPCNYTISEYVIDFNLKKVSD